jgi:hypothetical protein
MPPLSAFSGRNYSRFGLIWTTPSENPVYCNAGRRG